MEAPAHDTRKGIYLHDATEVVRALAHPLRLRIIELLYRQAPLNVYAIYTGLNIEQSIASQHLRILRQTRLVNTRRQGKEIYYLPDKQRLEKVAAVALELSTMVQKI